MNMKVRIDIVLGGAIVGQEDYALRASRNRRFESVAFQYFLLWSGWGENKHPFGAGKRGRQSFRLRKVADYRHRTRSDTFCLVLVSDKSADAMARAVQLPDKR